LIHYHGGPITPERSAFSIWKGRHAFISFAHPEQIGIASLVCQSFALDNGAFSFWKSKKEVRWEDYYQWVDKWSHHPACDWAVIPDVIEGSEKENDALVRQWPLKGFGVPVFHLNESFDRLSRLIGLGFTRIALGSSGEYDVSMVKKCLKRLFQIFEHINKHHPKEHLRFHGMRMLNRQIITAVPLASADSTTVARNIGLDIHWKRFGNVEKTTRGLILIDSLEGAKTPSTPIEQGSIDQTPGLIFT